MMKQIISLQIDDSIAEELRVIATKEDMSVSALIRRLIKQYLKEQKHEVQLQENTR